MENQEKDIRITVNKEKKELIFVAKKKVEDYNKILLEGIITTAYKYNAILKFYELNGEFICVFNSERIEEIEKHLKIWTYFC